MTDNPWVVAFENMMRKSYVSYVRHAIIHEPYDGAFETEILPKLTGIEREEAEKYVASLKALKEKP